MFQEQCYLQTVADDDRVESRIDLDVLRERTASRLINHLKLLQTAQKNVVSVITCTSYTFTENMR